MTNRKTITVLSRVLTFLVIVVISALSAWLSFGFAKKARAEEISPRAADFDHSGADELGQAVTELSTGSYYITDDIALPQAIDIKSDSTVSLCLHGHTLSATNRYAFEIYGALDLYDCGGDAHTDGIITVKGIDVYGGTFNMYGGNIREVRSNYYSGGGVVVSNGGVFNMYGGAITDNIATGGGGGVLVAYNGTFNMYDGLIANNTTTNTYGGAGVCVNGKAFHMYGGTITNNYVKTPADADAETLEKFYHGAGVSVIGSEFSIEGDVNITGNSRGPTTSDLQSNNVQLSSGQKIEITGPLGENARIGVTVGTADFTNGYSANNSEPPTKYFSSDDENFSIGYNPETNECTKVDADAVTYTMESATVTGTSGAEYGATKVTFTLDLSLSGSDGSTPTKTVFHEQPLSQPLARGKNTGSFNFTYLGKTVSVTYEIDIPKPRAYVFWVCGGTQTAGSTYKYKRDGNDVKNTVVARYDDENGETVRVKGSESDDIIAEDEYGNPVTNTAKPGIYYFHLKPNGEYTFDNNLLTVTVYSDGMDDFNLDDASVIGVVGSPTVGDRSFTVKLKRKLIHTADSELDKEDQIDYIVNVTTPLSLGTQTVGFSYTYTGYDETKTVPLSVEVTAGKKYVSVRWYYDSVISYNNSANHVYDGNDMRGNIYAEYDGYDGVKKRVMGVSTDMLKADADGNPVTSMSAIGVYKLSLAAVAEYEFSNNLFTYSVVEKIEDITDLKYEEDGTVILGVSYADGHAFAEGTELDVKNVSITETVVAGEIKSAMEVKFVKNSAQIATSGKLSVLVLVPESVRGEDNYLIYNLKNGVATKVEYSRDGNYAMFETNELNTLLFVVDKDAPPRPTPDPDPDPNPDPDPDPNPNPNPNPDPDPDPNGGNNLLWLWILLAILGAGAIVAVVIIVVKRKKKEQPAASSETAESSARAQAIDGICPVCGYKNEIGAMFCESCGKKLEVVAVAIAASEEAKPEEPLKPEQKPEAGVCPECGYKNEEGAMFCESCGKKLEPEQKPEPKKSKPEKKPKEKPEQKPEQKPTNICPACGQQNEEGAMFCEGCGNKLK